MLNAFAETRCEPMPYLQSQPLWRGRRTATKPTVGANRKQRERKEIQEIQAQCVWRGSLIYDAMEQQHKAKGGEADGINAIDQLQIEIQANSTNAASSIDALSASLTRLRSSVKGWRWAYYHYKTISRVCTGRTSHASACTQKIDLWR